MNAADIERIGFHAYFALARPRCRAKSAEGVRCDHSAWHLVDPDAPRPHLADRGEFRFVWGADDVQRKSATA